MTRENKLALVVGFGLILFVGILISDHFSAANRQEAANLLPDRPPDPMAQARWQDPELIDLDPPPPATAVLPPPVATNHTAMVSAEPPRKRDAAPRISMGPTPGQQRPTPTPAVSMQSPPPSERRHVVGTGETLTQISRRYYGTGAAAAALARYNKVANPNTITVGVSLRIPPGSQLGVSSSPALGAPTPVARPAFASYTVRGGDTLSELAQRLMGSSRQWQRLYQLNRDVIPNPDALRAGIVIKVPQDT